MPDLTIAGDLRLCPTCAAPMVSPFPVDWILEMVMEGPPAGPVRSFLTPHRPGCTYPPANPRPGRAVRVPGAFVVDLNMLPPGNHVCDCGRVFETRAGLVAHREQALNALRAVGTVMLGRPLPPPTQGVN